MGNIINYFLYFFFQVNSFPSEFDLKYYYNYDDVVKFLLPLLSLYELYFFEIIKNNNYFNFFFFVILIFPAINLVLSWVTYRNNNGNLFSWEYFKIFRYYFNYLFIVLSVFLIIFISVLFIDIFPNYYLDLINKILVQSSREFILFLVVYYYLIFVMIICLILELLIKFYYFLEHYIISSFRFNFSYTELILDRCNIIYPLEIFVTNNVGELNSSNEEIENQEFNYDISISRQVFIHLYSIPNYLEELIDILRYTLSKNLVSMSGYSNEDVNIEDIFNYITNIAANTLVYGSMNSKQNLLVFLRNYFRDFSNGNKITFSDISNHFRCLSDELFFIDRIKPIKRNNLKNTITNLIIGLITSLIGGIVITYGGIVLTYLSNI